MKSVIDITNEEARVEWRGKHVFRGRIRHALLCRPEVNSMARSYLRDLRAAEMVAWQLSGGDYLISGATQSRREIAQGVI